MRLRRLLTAATAAVAVAGGLVTPPAAGAGPLRVYPLGDSITYGTTWRYPRPVTVPNVPPASPVDPNREPVYPLTSPGGYRLPLSALLTASGVAHEYVGTNRGNPPHKSVTDPKLISHNGHPGYYIHHSAAALDGVPVAPPSPSLGGYWLTGTATRAPITPDVTIVHLGTNDIYNKYDPLVPYAANYRDPAQRAVFVEHAGDRLRALVDKVQALRPGSAIVLSTLLPLALAEYDVVVKEFNAEVRQIAAEEAGQRVVLADPWPLFAADTPAGIVVVPGLFADGAHPTAAGYALLAAVLRDAVVAAAAS